MAEGNGTWDIFKGTFTQLFAAVFGKTCSLL